MSWNQTVFECLLVEENSILLVCAAKIRFLKLPEADHERDADEPNSTRTKWTTYPTNKQAKEEIACVGLDRSLEQCLQHVGLHYSAERSLQRCFAGRERLRTVAFHVRTCCYCDYLQFMANWISHDTKSHPTP